MNEYICVCSATKWDKFNIAKAHFRLALALQAEEKFGGACEAFNKSLVRKLHKYRSIDQSINR